LHYIYVAIRRIKSLGAFSSYVEPCAIDSGRTQTTIVDTQ